MSKPSLPRTRKAPLAPSAGAIREGRRAYAAASLLVSVVLLVALAACGETASPRAAVQAVESPAELSETARRGQALFDANCAQCHGAAAVGTAQGPTLIDRIYHPGHHGDASFHLAVQRGVRQHHWQFGNMLPVPSLAADEVGLIVCYVRELQRANGIFKASEYRMTC